MSANKRKKLEPLNFFFYKGELHKRLRINRSADIVIAWSYPQGHAVKHIYSDVRKNGQKAFTTGQVCKMINRKHRTLKNIIDDGMIPAPAMSYGIDENRNPYGYYWREEDVMNLHEYLLTVHHGRPRKDGYVFPMMMPSRAELRAIIRQGTVLYVRTDDGEFIPTWEAHQF